MHHLLRIEQIHSFAVLTLSNATYGAAVGIFFCKQRRTDVEGDALHGQLCIYIAVIAYRLAAGAADKTARDVGCCPLTDLSKFCLFGCRQQLCICRCRFRIYAAVISDEVFAISVTDELVKIIVAYDNIAISNVISDLSFIVFNG